ncbi:hypothetical protein [Rhizobium sp. RAF56]|uniref:hypothetical protein n=1 Tax=Rhizobium sp. RAF56 TaxID=3233062 RepID=UPI003F9502F0
MTNEDLRISTADEDTTQDFFSTFQVEADAHASDAPRTEVAQAADIQPAAGEREAAVHVTNIVPYESSVAHLAATPSTVNIRVEGSSLVLVEADGTKIVFVNGGPHMPPSLLIGDAALTQQAVIAAFEEKHLNVVEGPDGTYSVSLWSSGGNFHDDLDFSGSLDSSLLPPTEFTTELLADTPLSEAEADAPRLFVGIDRGHGHGDGSPLGDIFIGGAGDDTYVVDSTNDIVDETAPGSGGIDTVLSSIDYTACRH